MTDKPMRVAVYVRVSRLDQHPENQRVELERYVAFRRWQPTWFVEHGVSGAKERRPELDRMLAEVRRGSFDAVLCLKLDRLGRNLGHLIALAEELRTLGVDLVTTDGIDTTSPHGKLMFHVLGAVAEFERERLKERTVLGLERARRTGTRLGRPEDQQLRARMRDVRDLSVRAAAAKLGCSPTTVQKLRAAL